ncbi:Cx9C motif-containing protein 4, mitochondrial [Yarrowia lipolytica]|uniref:Cx9C motif-containing protein 4, mitochondrial n=2 Tax=Yarrowia lipolytica TaxID=4952 RepID=CMC4_YARLI|nr:YALI0E24409p [Yarrowia lipolytica CLIB122]Q6C4R1.2 RecName: Full=Cx9C motif-containing protein 4, mitochondrial [Yarrowia lipolytica CLIB122]AOW05911.1 hypothetical protein YALI1_E29074g [Yarrowia lipolytica]KAB8285895.1 Cx9C motif-containing protein 4, mitochondrial [Yarrowia lipolytica]KAE8171782.1 Cx9C motif-containing protein 4, mitochondrial [Yarrowia lipolytica]KAJ8057326.1 Cx9C motif-containing protein 4, mitochondrial [Yarrowia lipolytica]QNP99955.1 Cx9C motif-containing protein 4 |eukprot:XP_504351.2 YALI0E24409p [Yarrowia lipolytica CLIB122]
MAEEEIDYNSQPCHAYACRIQDCLQRSGYNESKCTKLIDELYECCAKFYMSKGEDARSTSCPKPNLLKLKIQQRESKDVDAVLLEFAKK